MAERWIHIYAILLELICIWKVTTWVSLTPVKNKHHTQNETEGFFLQETFSPYTCSYKQFRLKGQGHEIRMAWCSGMVE